MADPWSTMGTHNAAFHSAIGADVEIALLDRSGVIIAVNEAWEQFSRHNGGDPERTGVGVNYLDVCAAVSGDPTADAMGSAIRAAIAGELFDARKLEIPCHGPDHERWFDVLISARIDDSGAPLGATVSLALSRSIDRSARPAAGRAPGDEPLRRVTLVARALSGGLELRELVHIVVQQGIAGLGAEAATLALLDDDGVLRPLAGLDRPSPASAAIGPIALDRDLPMPSAIRRRAPVWLPSRADGELRFPDLATVDLTSQAWAALPLEVGGAVIGAMGVSFSRAHPFTPADKLYLGALADLTALALPAATLTATGAAHQPALADAVLDGAPDGIVVCDADGRIVLVNGLIEAMFGHDRRSLAGQPIEILLPERSRAFHQSFRRDYTAAPTSRPMGIGRVFRGRAADGAELAVEVGLAPITAGAGTYTVAIVRRAPVEAERHPTVIVAPPDDRSEPTIRRLVGAGLMLSALTNQLTLDDHQRARLVAILDHLDRAVDELLHVDRADPPDGAGPPTTG